MPSENGSLHVDRGALGPGWLRLDSQAGALWVCALRGTGPALAALADADATPLGLPADLAALRGAVVLRSGERLTLGGEAHLHRDGGLALTLCRAVDASQWYGARLELWTIA